MFMKKPILLFLSIALVSATVLSGGDEKLTFKEKVEQSKQVKVFFNLREIVDEYDENLLKAGNPDALTPVRTSIPADFAGNQIKDSVLNILNRGLEVGAAFVEGDITALPPSKNKKTQFRDLSGLPDGFYAIVDIFGEYKRTIQKKVVDGNTTLEAFHSMELKSKMYFYDVSKGEAERYGDMSIKSGVLLGNTSSRVVKSDKLENKEYMEMQFPPIMLYEEYKKTTYRFATSFAENQLKKHSKAVSKRK